MNFWNLDQSKWQTQRKSYTNETPAANDYVPSIEGNLVEQRERDMGSTHSILFEATTNVAVSKNTIDESIENIKRNPFSSADLKRNWGRKASWWCVHEVAYWNQPYNW